MALRKIELARAAWGAALLVAPRRTLTWIPRVEVDARSLAVARVLGLRQLIQALLSGVHPSPEILALGIWVDSAHAATALSLAAIDPRRANGGLADAAVATTWAALGWRDLVSSPVTEQGTRAAPGRRRDALGLSVLNLLPLGGALRNRAAARGEPSG